MEKERPSTKQNIIDIFLSACRGLLVGFFSCVPFMNTGLLKKTLHQKESGFEKAYTSIIPYLFFFAFSFSMFFFIPMDYMIEKYHTGIYAGLGVMSLVFLVAECYSMMKNLNKNKWHLIASAITGVVVIGLMIGFYYIPVKEIENTDKIIYIVALYLLVISFISSFTGISVTSVLFFLEYYLTYASSLRETLYKGTKSCILMVILFFIAIAVGKITYLLFQKHLDKLSNEKHAANIGFFLSGILIIAIYKLKAPWFYESTDITKTAQLITMGMTIFAFLLVSFVLTVPVYPFGKKELPN